MLIIIDRKAPEKARQSLARYGEVIELATSAITYEAISGHPDIFLCQCGDEFIVAPNLPAEYLDSLSRINMHMIIGHNPVGTEYPATARYNAVFSEGRLVHNLVLTEPAILDRAASENRIHVSQGYCRCNLIPLGNDSYITSDAGIQKVLSGMEFHSLYVDPSETILPGFPHGFIGGTCGICSGQVFFIGSLYHHSQEKEIRSFLYDLQLEVVELYDGPLFDGGGVMFIE